MIRAFVGLALPWEVIERLKAAQAGLPIGRALEPETLHITLAFLGEQQGPIIEDVHHALESVAAPGFDLQISGIGIFGGGQPRLLYAAVTPNPELKALRHAVQSAARNAGIPMPRAKFVPHVSLARFPKSLPAEDLARLQHFAARRMSFDAGIFPVTRFTLFRSHLGQRGASYEALAEYPLRG